MDLSDTRATSAGASSIGEILWQDTERVFCKLSRADSERDLHAFVPAYSDAEPPTIQSIERLAHEFSLKDHLDASWALRPLELVRDRGRTMLIVDYPGGAPLDRLIDRPMDIGRFLRLAIGLSSALGRLHARGLIHKNIKPANVLANPHTGQVWLTGFGIASRLLRERQAPEPPEFIAGTLAYMAPEQTGRVNRSIDSRSDLYSLGVTFYEMLTARLPFAASDPMEWVHCHIARPPMVTDEHWKLVPSSIATITMKLLAKTADERYQTAAGVESDLRRCLAEWEASGTISEFAPGAHDVPDRLMLPERLYGRDREIDTLLTAFDRIVGGGRPELVLVSGYSGIGKSAVVNELHKPLVPPRGLFASGKFDQYKRDIPYATLAQAFQSLIRPLLSRDEEELRRWRDALIEALDPNASLIVELVPELRHIIGEQPPVPELAPQEAQRRFQLVFRRFIGVFARPEHPLALFLDDLQWLDAATLDLLEDLLTHLDLQHLLLIGAYRDNEVSATHPLIRKLEAIRQAGATLQDIVLSPLTRDDLRQLLSDSLRCELERAEPLAQLLHDKTRGNPFFAIQFIGTLADEGLLAFDYAAGRWAWDLDRIRAKGYTDNVVELMVGKLARLPVATRNALQQFACMGARADFDMLRMVYQESAEELHEHLWEAVHAGLIFRSEDSYRFLHDRVQEAAYSLIPQDRRAAAHLHIGMLLAEHTPAEKRDAAVFEIVNQLNRGAGLIDAVAERERVAELNLIAGRRAKVSTAYASALKYLQAGRALLTEATWQRNYPLVFAIEYLMAECELLTAEMVAAENRLSMLAERATNRHDHCIVTRLRLTLYTTLDRSDRSAEVFVDWLHRDGTVWSVHPSREDVQREYERIWALLGDRRIEDLIDLPLITDPDILDTLDVTTEIVTPALMFDENLSTLVVCRLVTLSLEHGNSDGSCFGYVWLAMFSGPRFNNYKDGFRFGQLGYDLVEKRGLTRYQARTYMNVGCTVLPWVQHVASGRELIRRAFDAAYRVGDLTFASYSWDQIVTNYLAVGDPLAETQAECEKGLAFAQQHGFGLVVELCGAQLGLVRTLRGVTSSFGPLDYDGYTELDTERRFADNKNLALAEFYYWTRKCQARFIAGDIASAADAAIRGAPLAWTSSGQFETAEHPLYAGLAQARAWDSATPEQRAQHLAAVTRYHEQLSVWAEHNPATFENRAAIVGAELARIEGRTLEAQDLYEKALRAARKNGFVHHEAFSNELAGRFHLSRGLDRVATTYFRDARHCYVRWGADAKVRQLEYEFPQLKEENRIAASTSTIVASVEHVDLTTVIRMSEAISGEIVLEKLIDTLMRTAIEHAGAARGLLLLPRDEALWIEAEATTGTSDVHVALLQVAASESLLPLSVLRYAVRTKEPVLLQDAASESAFSSDPYFSSRRARSVLCLPILKQARLIGMLYLENSLTAHLFTPARMAILKLLASEAAISIENARLYRDVAQAAEALRSFQMELAHANRLATMGQLAASIAHEVNQPIGAARNNAHAALRFLNRETPDLDEVREALESVVSETYRAGDIIGGIRDQVRKVPPRMDATDINDAIDEVFALVRAELSKHRVSVELRLADDLPLVRADKVQLQQVMLNLILNAIEALISVDNDVRELAISTQASAEGVLVSVMDSGPGIAAENRERVFDSFYTTKEGGVGIGLSICRSIIDAHGGQLWADAQSPRGAALKFTLPLRD
jgi:predicted ATPase/signal transduction histidine kinase